MEKVNDPKKAWQSAGEIVQDIPADKKPGWVWTVRNQNGELVTLKDVARITGRQEGLGITIEYGLVDGLYDAPKFQENEGGGDIILPAVILDDVVHLGLTQIPRNGNLVWEFPRAFINDGATVVDIAVNEAAAMCEKITCDVRQVGGRYNPNSTFFVTQTWVDESENVRNDGITYFILRVKAENLMKDKDGKHFAFRDEFQATAKTSGTGKKMLTCVFFPLEDVKKMVRSGEIHDQFVGCGLTVAEEELTAKMLQQ